MPFDEHFLLSVLERSPLATVIYDSEDLNIAFPTGNAGYMACKQLNFRAKISLNFLAKKSLFKI